MKAMILAAGRGERMRPLSDAIPKPLISVAGRPLIEHHLIQLAAAGISEFIINLGWLGQKLSEYLGGGARFGVRIAYSDEGWPALETGGGIARALPLLGKGPFVLVNGDVYADFPWKSLLTRARAMPADQLAHLVLVPNPSHNAGGDFGLVDGLIQNQPRTGTFSGISIHRPELFTGGPAGAFPLSPLWRAAAEKQQLGGEIFTGLWSDVGTPERLQQLQDQMQSGIVQTSGGSHG